MTGICELASELSRGLSSRTRTIGGIAATAFLSFFLSHMPATFASAGPNDGDRSGQQQEDRDIEFYHLNNDGIYVTNNNTHYVNVPGEEASVRVIPYLLERTVKIRAKHSADIQPWLKVYQEGEVIYHGEMNRLDKKRLRTSHETDQNEAESNEAISSYRVTVTSPNQYIKLEVTQPNSDEVIQGIVPSNEGEAAVDIEPQPQDAVNVTLTHKDGNNFAEFELPGGYEFFTVHITRDGETQELNIVDKYLYDSLSGSGEFDSIGGSRIMKTMDPVKLQDRSVLGIDDRTRDYKAMATEVLRNFYREHREVAKYLAQRGLEYREGYFPEHITGGTSSSPFLTQIDFRTGTARIYEAGNSDITQDPQITFKVEAQRNRTRAFHEGVIVDSYITSDRRALNSLISALDSVVASYEAAQKLTDNKLGGKRKVLVVADAETVGSDAYQYLVNKMFFGANNHLQFSLIDPNSEAGQKSLARYQSATGEQFQEGGILFEYMQIGTGEKGYTEVGSDYVVRTMHTNAEFIPIINFILDKGHSKPNDYATEGALYPDGVIE